MIGANVGYGVADYSNGLTNANIYGNLIADPNPFPILLADGTNINVYDNVTVLR